MPLPVLTRRAWEGLLAALPQRLLRSLDDWAGNRAKGRAERRRRALKAARSQA